ncbi:hypothetical protein ES702_01486 [subsurface metagenome]
MVWDGRRHLGYSHNNRWHSEAQLLFLRAVRVHGSSGEDPVQEGWRGIVHGAW